MPKWSEDPIEEELPRLISEDPQLSLRKVAEGAGVDPTHLSRALRHKSDKYVSGELAGRIAKALGLAVDYFPEYRQHVVIEAVIEDPALRDRVYKRLR